MLWDGHDPHIPIDVANKAKKKNENFCGGGIETVTLYILGRRGFWLKFTY